MYVRKWLHVILSGLVLAACSGVLDGEVGGGGPPRDSQVARITAVVITNTPQSTPTHAATISPTPAYTITKTATPKPKFKLCTPLPLHPLEILEEIIGDPYDPPRP